MNIVDIFTILASIFTGASVLFAIYSYLRNQDKGLFSNVRLSLVDSEQKCNELIDLLGEPLFTDISTNIVKELKKILSKSDDKDYLLKYFTNEANHDYILQCIHLGVHNSASIKSIKKLMSEIKKLPYLYRDPFPLFYEIIGILENTVISSCNSIISSDLFNLVLNDKEYVEDSLLEIFNEKNDDKDLLLEITLLLVVSQNVAYEETAKKIMDEAQYLLSFITQKFSQFTDNQLRKERNRQKNLLNKIVVETTENFVDELFDFLKLIRIHMNDSEWDNIVESKTRLYESVKEDEAE